jgi:ligand-binding sensor domain-containing protein
VRVWWLLLIVVGVNAAPAGVGEWKTYTAKRDVRDIATRGDMIWSVTSGGLFSYNTSTGEYSQYTTSDGLKTNDLTAITADPTGYLWIGAANGIVHRFMPVTGDWMYITDISILNNPQKRINALQVIGDTLFILSDVGVSLYSVSHLEFGDTYARFGASPGQLVGNVTSMEYFDGKLWVGTRNGLASTQTSNPNPTFPDSWQVYTIAQGLLSNTITQLAVSTTELYAATTLGISLFTESGWQNLVGSEGLNVLDLDVRPNGVYNFITPTQLWSNLAGDLTGGDPIILIDQFLSSLTKIEERHVLGTSSMGLFTFNEGPNPLKSHHSADDNAVGDYLIPPGPPSNRFISLAVDARGALWSGTGSSNGQGVMMFNGSEWKSYTAQQYPQLRINEYHKVSIGPNNSKWCGSWGKGVAIINDAGEVQKVLNTTNGLPPTLAVDTNFSIVGGVATDQSGVTWLTNRTADDSTAAVLFYPDSSLSYDVRMSMRNPDIVFTDVVIDFNNTKWFSNYSRFENITPSAVYYYNRQLNISGTGTGWGRLTTTEGLTSNYANTIAVDRQGEVWIGSEQGISIIFDPMFPRQRMAIYHPLRDQIIQAIAVDALNNKWIGTKQGAFLLSSDGTVILERYNVENTGGKLLDNDVASIAIDHSTGIVYFGTEKGLSSLSTAAVNPARSFDQLKISPNPFILPSQVSLTIDGLVENSTLKILTVDGKLVREIVTPGGRVGFWDGNDASGETAASGIYLVVAFTEDGSEVATGKVAVVRR